MPVTTTWGGVALNVLQGTYKPPHVEDNGMVEIKILPQPGATTPTTVLQQAGRTRKRIKFSGWVRSWTDYNSLLTDYTAATKKSFADTDTGTTMDCIISKLSEPDFIRADLIRYSVELIEA